MCPKCWLVTLNSLIYSFVTPESKIYVRNISLVFIFLLILVFLGIIYRTGFVFFCNYAKATALAKSNLKLQGHLNIWISFRYSAIYNIILKVKDNIILKVKYNIVHMILVKILSKLCKSHRPYCFYLFEFSNDYVNTFLNF